MKALVFHGPGQSAWQDVPDPDIEDADRRDRPRRRRHHLRHRPAHPQGRRARGTARARSSATRPSARSSRPAATYARVRPGDRVLISCISACGRCRFCREGAYGQCRGGGGWILGHLIDGTQAEYVRVPFADLSVHPLPGAVDSQDAVLLADIFPTAYEVGVLNGRVRPGDTVVVVGAGPDRARRDRHRAALLPRADHRRRPRRLPARRRQAPRRRRRGRRRRGARAAGRRPHRRARRRCGHRGGRRAGELRDVHPHGAARRARRQRRRARQARHPAPRRPVDQERDDHHRPGRHLLHPHPAAHDGRRPAARRRRWSPTPSRWTRWRRRTTSSPAPPTPARSRSCSAANPAAPSPSQRPEEATGGELLRRTRPRARARGPESAAIGYGRQDRTALPAARTALPVSDRPRTG